KVAEISRVAPGEVEVFAVAAARPEHPNAPPEVVVQLACEAQPLRIPTPIAELPRLRDVRILSIEQIPGLRKHPLAYEDAARVVVVDGRLGRLEANGVVGMNRPEDSTRCDPRWIGAGHDLLARGAKRC